MERPAAVGLRVTFDPGDTTRVTMTLLFLPVVWLTVLLFGCMAMLWAVGVEVARRAFTVNGSSLLTLGFVPVECALTLAPYAPWSSDRSLATWDRTPTIKRWAQRLRDRT